MQGGNLNNSFVVEGMAIARRSSGVENSKEKAKVGLRLSEPLPKGILVDN